MGHERSDGRLTTRRRFLAAGATTAGSLYIAACGGSSNKSSSGGSASGGGGGGGKPVTLNNLFMQQAGYSPKDLAGMTAQFEKAYPNIKVKNTLVAYDALHDKIVAAAPAGTYDVVLGDCIWPAEFATRNIVLDITDKVNSQDVKGIFPGAIDMAKYNGKYYGEPWLLDTKYLFTNGKMLKKAGVSNDDFGTLDDMVAALKKLKASGVKYPWIGSWARAEAVVCDYAQFLGAYGGKFLDDKGKPAFNTGGGVQALEFMQMLIKDGLANPSSTSALEADVLKAFQQGQAAANLNWTFQLAGAKDTSQSKVANDDVSILHTPKGTAPVAPSCNGGQPLMITTGSKHPDEAWTYIKFISSQKVQNNFVADSLPIWSSSYDDPAVVSAAGEQLVATAKTQLPDMILRPQVTNYNAASKALQVEIQNALLGKKDPQTALNDAAKAFTSIVP
jgi:multiple sugar transport system substrate-binding protein